MVVLNKTKLGCDLGYRSYSIDAFDASLKDSYRKSVIITYTSSNSVASIFEVIEKRFSSIEKLNMIIGFNLPVDARKTREIFVKSIEDIQARISKGMWFDMDLNVTFHNHCHIKYYQFDGDCVTGSQNFTGPSFASEQRYSSSKNNELLINLQAEEDDLSAITNSLLEEVLANEDEYLSLNKWNLLDIEPSKILDELYKKREQNKKIRFESLKGLCLEDFEDSEWEVPEIFQIIYSMSNSIGWVQSGHASYNENLTDSLKLFLDELELYAGCKEVSEKVLTLLDESKGRTPLYTNLMPVCDV